MTEDEMVGWHHQLNGHKFEQTPGNCEGWGSQTPRESQTVRHNLVTVKQQPIH